MKKSDLNSKKTNCTVTSRAVVVAKDSQGKYKLRSLPSRGLDSIITFLWYQECLNHPK